MRLQSAGWQLRPMLSRWHQLSQRSTAWPALARRLCSERSAAALALAAARLERRPNAIRPQQPNRPELHQMRRDQLCHALRVSLRSSVVAVGSVSLQHGAAQRLEVRQHAANGLRSLGQHAICGAATIPQRRQIPLAFRSLPGTVPESTTE